MTTLTERDHAEWREYATSPAAQAIATEWTKVDSLTTDAARVIAEFADEMLAQSLKRRPAGEAK